MCLVVVLVEGVAVMDAMGLMIAAVASQDGDFNPEEALRVQTRYPTNSKRQILCGKESF